MRHWLAACLMLFCVSPTPGQEAPAAEIDRTDPIEVTEALFIAARTGDPSQLASLCHPEAETDGDLRRICELTTEHEMWSEFVEWFSRGKVSGPATITEGVAVVPILFGPDGTDEERLGLILLEGRWYLASL